MSKPTKRPLFERLVAPRNEPKPESRRMRPSDKDYCYHCHGTRVMKGRGRWVTCSEC